MSFVKLDEQNFETTTVMLRPNVHFVSSSIDGIATGSTHVSAIRSKCIKQFISLENASNNLSEDQNPYSCPDVARGLALEGAKTSAKFGNDNINAQIKNYLSLINSASHDVRFDKKIDILRFDPPFKYTINSTIKNNLRNVLMPYHRHKYENLGFWYSNYNSLNFLNNSAIPTGSCLIYPNVSRSYDLPDDFAVNFWINPRYSRNNVDFKAGTILHISSSICISLVSGSLVNVKNEESDFKLLLQLSSSADIPPSNIDLSSPVGSPPNNLIFTSSFTLKKNHWHNVMVTWGNKQNNSYGSMYCDNNETNFYVPSQSLSCSADVPGLVIGNYYDGNVTDFAKLFGSHVASEGVDVLNPAFSSDPTIVENMFSHPLNAELHEVRIYKKFIDKKVKTNQQLMSSSVKNTDDLIFYVPPFFYPTSSLRNILSTPFQTISSTTNDPFNVSFSFGVGGKLINLENFTLDFVNMRQPRHIGLFPKTISTTIQDITADQYVYEHITNGSGDIVNDRGRTLKRNLSLLPCDNGLFTPDYTLLKNSDMSGSAAYKKILSKGDMRDTDYSIISLENLVATSSLFPGLVFESGSILDAIIGAAPENPGVAPGSVLTIAQRTRDVSSNEITLYDISNLYYGNKIHPGSVLITEESLTGSLGDISIKIKDNGNGSLYRADCLTPQAKFNSIGNVLYEEGIIFIKTPHLFYFNKDKTDLKFRGEQNIHTFTVNVPCNEWNFNSSSNPSYEKITPSDGSQDIDLSTIYITTVNIHDDNFNIIMKANLAQPILKSEDDEFVIRLKQDF